MTLAVQPSDARGSSKTFYFIKLFGSSPADQTLR